MMSFFSRDKDEAAASPASPVAQEQTSPGVETAAAAAAVVATGGVAASSEWMTTLLAKMWPYVSQAVQKQVMEIVPGIIDANKPKWMEGIEISKFELGPVPPKITFVNVDQHNDDEVDDIRLEIGMDWQSKADIELKVMPLPEGMPKFLKWTASINAGVENLSVKATTVVTLVPMVGVIPVVKAAQVCLREQPKVDFHLTFTSSQSGILNLLKPFILKIVRMIMASMVYPEHICVKLDPNVPDYFKPEGLLVVRVIEAQNLPKSDWFSRGDPLVDVFVRDKWKKTTKVAKGSSPKWDEEFELMLHSRRFQRLNLTLLDEDSGSSADTIGVAGCSLAELVPGEEVDVWLDVFDEGEPDKKLDDARIHVKLLYLSDAAPSVQAIRADTSDGPFPPGGATMKHGGIVKVSFRSVTAPSPDDLPIMALVKAAGKEFASGMIYVNKQAPTVSTIPTIQAFNYDILAADKDTDITITFTKGKGKDTLATFSTSLAEVKAKDPQVGISGGLFEFSSNGYALQTDIYYHPI